MKSMIKELWHGNVCPQTDEQKEIFEKFYDCWSKYASYAEVPIFEYAFKLGMQIAIETLE